MFFMTQIGPITPFGLGEPFPGTTWLLVSLTLLLLLVYWLRTAVWFGFANRLAGLPAFWLRLLLAAVTLLAVLTAPSLPLLLFTWSLLLLAWAAVALPLPDLVQTKRGFVWLWGPLAAWTVTAAAFPLPNSLYDQINSIPTAGHLIMALGLLLPLVCWPLWGRSLLWVEDSRETAVLILLWPTLAAAGLLGRLLLATGPDWSLLWPLLLLAALPIGLTLLWPRLAPPVRARYGQGRAFIERQGRALYRAVADALLLLEGEAGLLWLLGLLVLALLFT
jgi:hypothetical protein